MLNNEFPNKCERKVNDVSKVHEAIVFWNEIHAKQKNKDCLNLCNDKSSKLEFVHAVPPALKVKQGKTLSDSD